MSHNGFIYEARMDMMENSGHWVKKENLVFVNFSAQDASILKISVSIIKRRSYFFMVLSQFMANKKVLGVFWNP